MRSATSSSMCVNLVRSIFVNILSESHLLTSYLLCQLAITLTLSFVGHTQSQTHTQNTYSQTQNKKQSQTFCHWVVAYMALSSPTWHLSSPTWHSLQSRYIVSASWSASTNVFLHAHMKVISFNSFDIDNVKSQNHNHKSKFPNNENKYNALESWHIFGFECYILAYLRETDARDRWVLDH